jgi:hypothetical protein
MSRIQRSIALSVALASAAATGCGQKKSGSGAIEFRIGEPLLVRPFTYTVLETRWKPQLGELFSMQIPQHQFLLIRLSITNSGGSPAAAPLLTLEGPDGTVHNEHQKGEGLANWLGLIRIVPPAQTDEGWIIFDVPPNNYVLRCYGEVIDDVEQVGLFRIPLNLDSMNETPMVDIPGAPSPDKR